MITDTSPTDAPTGHDPAALPGSDDQGRACGACPHTADAHDTLGIRFCAATTAGGHHRGCICSAGTPRPS